MPWFSKTSTPAIGTSNAHERARAKHECAHERARAKHECWHERYWREA